MKQLVIKLIEIYQRTLSLDSGWFERRGGYCRYQPHCSEYGRQAIIKHGLIYGGWLAFWRVLRCNPFSKGGMDPVK